MTQPVFQFLVMDHVWMSLLFQRIFSEVPVLMLLYSILDHLYGRFSCFRGLFRQVQDSAYNLRSKLSFSVVFFWMVHKKKLFTRYRLSIGPFQKAQSKVVYFPYVVRKNCKAGINCPKMVVYTVENLKFLVRIISEHT